MIPNVEKANATPFPLPAAVWYVNHDLLTAIDRCLTEAGHQIVSSSLSKDCRHWQFHLTLGQMVDVWVDNQTNPGTITIVVSGKDSKSVQTLLNPYKQIPILKISITRTADELLYTVPKPIYEPTLWSFTERLKYAIRYWIRHAKYKIVREKSSFLPAAWFVCLSTAQQLQIGDFRTYERGLRITGFGTDLRRLEQLMAVFDR
jgi:hypothetical protein